MTRQRKRAASAGPIEVPQLLNQNQVAALLGMSARTLEGRRSRGEGPRFVKLGRGLRAPVRYDPKDVAEFLAAGARGAER
jgi:hypothetical protein